MFYVRPLHDLCDIHPSRSISRLHPNHRRRPARVPSSVRVAGSRRLGPVDSPCLRQLRYPRYAASPPRNESLFRPRWEKVTSRIPSKWSFPAPNNPHVANSDPPFRRRGCSTSSRESRPFRRLVVVKLVLGIRVVKVVDHP